MVEISDGLRCVFHAEVKDRQNSYVIEIPKREITNGAVQPGTSHRVAMFPTASTRSKDAASEQNRDRGPDHKQGGGGDHIGPPVAEGEQRTVDIEAIGEQGDGIARVERGYVIIVPDTEQGERVTIEITDVKENVAFGDVVGREDYYE